MKTFLIIICWSFWAISSIAQATESATPARFEKPSEKGAGWVNLRSSLGQYVYGEPEINRVKTSASGKPFFIGVLERKDYEFYSYQEEEALWLVVQDQIEAMQPKPTGKTKTNRAETKMTWPKVVIRGQEVCVPVLESANAEDWREHLTCTEVSRHD